MPTSLQSHWNSRALFAPVRYVDNELKGCYLLRIICKISSANTVARRFIRISCSNMYICLLFFFILSNTLYFALFIRNWFISSPPSECWIRHSAFGKYTTVKLFMSNTHLFSISNWPVNKQSLQVFLFIAKLLKTNNPAESVTNGSKKHRVIVNRTKTAYKSPELSFFGLKVN